MNDMKITLETGKLLPGVVHAYFEEGACVYGHTRTGGDFNQSAF